MICKRRNPISCIALFLVHGKTKLVYEALQIVKKKKYRTISLTETLNSPIADLANAALEIGSENEEYLYRTFGYSATYAGIILDLYIFIRYL